ncbi:MAG: alpha-amylase family glycosyl hydrolase [Verrucomicrobiota bacterium]
MKMSRSTPGWLADAIFYEIYPQSFMDTNGDGIGDLAGIIQKLDYIQSLGCTAIWLNPCFESPFGDAGYDVSDFYKVAPRYGTNRDLTRLFREAHKRGMKVCLDLVAGHTSIEHPWFKASSSPQKNKHSNWYVWTDNPWIESAGNLSMVRGSSDRSGAFASNFFFFQPALNYGFYKPDPKQPWQLPMDHPDVLALREEMKNIMRFWMNLGADGFRVDMAMSLVKNDPNLKGTMQFWSDIRNMYDKEYPNNVLIAEWSYPKYALKAGFHIDFMIHFGTEAYTTLFRNEVERDAFRAPNSKSKGNSTSFFDKAGKGSVTTFLKHYIDHYQTTKSLGYISLPTGNHDITRISLGRTTRELELIYSFLWTMPGIPYLYYGDEIGMRYLPDLESKEGGYGRTGSRTPMQWNNRKNAGFSTAHATKLYLPIDGSKNRPTVEDQEIRKTSLLNHVRSLSNLRRTHPVLANDGIFEVVHAKRNGFPFIYLRRKGKQKYLVALNPSNRSTSTKLRTLKFKKAPEPLIEKGAHWESNETLPTIELKPVSYGIYKL